MRRLLLSMLLLCHGVVHGGEVLQAHAGYDHGLYSVEVDMRLAVERDAAWRLLTDYAGYEKLNDAIRLSEVLERRGEDDYRVRTVTEACVYFFCRTLVQVQDVIESNENYLVATVLPEYSHFRHGVARLYVWEEGGMTRVRLVAEVEPDFWIPPLVGPWLITRKLRSEALETVRNVERLGGVEAPAAM